MTKWNLIVIRRDSLCYVCVWSVLFSFCHWLFRSATSGAPTCSFTSVPTCSCTGVSLLLLLLLPHNFCITETLKIYLIKHQLSLMCIIYAGNWNMKCNMSTKFHPILKWRYTITAHGLSVQQDGETAGRTTSRNGQGSAKTWGRTSWRPTVVNIPWGNVLMMNSFDLIFFSPV